MSATLLEHNKQVKVKGIDQLNIERIAVKAHFQSIRRSQIACDLSIAIDCGLEGKASHVKAEWRHLKDTYRTKLKMLTPKSADAGGAKKVCWQWMDKMSFLRKFYVVEAPTTSNFLTVDDGESNQTGELTNAHENDISHQ